MNRMYNWIIYFLAFAILAVGLAKAASADHDEHKERRDHQERRQNHNEHHNEDYLSPVNNATYKENCGSCHFAYQPGLLPSGSWNNILSGLEDHFGEVVELDPDMKKIIKDYLSANASEQSSSKRARKIMKSLGKETPLRITEIPYIQKKHHEISLDILKRESIGSLSNCSACHANAERGIYDDDDVVIPK